MLFNPTQPSKLLLFWMFDSPFYMRKISLLSMFISPFLSALSLSKIIELYFVFVFCSPCSAPFPSFFSILNSPYPVILQSLFFCPNHQITQFISCRFRLAGHSDYKLSNLSADFRHWTRFVLFLCPYASSVINLLIVSSCAAFTFPRTSCIDTNLSRAVVNQPIVPLMGRTSHRL